MGLLSAVAGKGSLRGENELDNANEANKSNAHQVRLPGFIVDEPIGLGDVVKHATQAFGIKPCGGCEARAAALNRWMVFSGKNTSKASK